MRPTGRAAVCAAILSVALAGCGGDGDGEDNSQRLPDKAADAGGAVGDDLVAGDAPTRKKEKSSARKLREAKSTAQLLIDALNKHDPAACELFTQRYLERALRERGKAAQERCVNKVRTDPGSFELLSFSSGSVAGNRATLGVVLRIGPRRRRLVIDLVLDKNGNWKLDARE